MSDTLGSRLRSLRLARSETQRQFARRLGMGWPTWSKIENGRLRPTPAELTHAAYLLGADDDEWVELMALHAAWKPAPPPDMRGAFICGRPNR